MKKKGEIMKISQMVRQLEKIKKKHGDLPVTVFNPESLVSESKLETEAAYISLAQDEKDRTCEVTIIDRETHESFG